MTGEELLDKLSKLTPEQLNLTVRMIIDYDGELSAECESISVVPESYRWLGSPAQIILGN